MTWTHRGPSFFILHLPDIRYEGCFVFCFILEWSLDYSVPYSGKLSTLYLQHERLSYEIIATGQELFEPFVANFFISERPSKCCPDQGLCFYLLAFNNRISELLHGERELDRIETEIFFWVGFVITFQSLI